MSFMQVLGWLVITSAVVLSFIRKDSTAGELIKIVQWWSILLLCYKAIGG